jgi:hypothetical protein
VSNIFDKTIGAWRALTTDDLPGQTAGGGASATNQTTQINLETQIRDRIGATDAAAAGTDTADSSLIGLIKRLLQRITSLVDRQPASPPQQGGGAVTSSTTRVTLATDGPGVTSLSSIDGKLPASLGAKPAAQSLAVTLASDGTFAQAMGVQGDSVATTDTGSFSLIALIKRVASNITSLLTATSSFRPVGSTVTVAVTSSGTAATALPSGSSVIRFTNSGSTVYAVAFGDGSMSISFDTAMDILPGTSEAITPTSGATHLRLITAANVTATAKYTGGTGA